MYYYIYTLSLSVMVNKFWPSTVRGKPSRSRNAPPASCTPGLPNYINNHKQININLTDPWSLEAVATRLRANPLPL